MKVVLVRQHPELEIFRGSAFSGPSYPKMSFGLLDKLESGSGLTRQQAVRRDKQRHLDQPALRPHRVQPALGGTGPHVRTNLVCNVLILPVLFGKGSTKDGRAPRRRGASCHGDRRRAGAHVRPESAAVSTCVTAWSMARRWPSGSAIEREGAR